MAVALVTSLALVGASALAWRQTPLSHRRLDIADAARPRPAGSYYLAYDRGGHVDHHILYHGIDRTALANMKAADVLFLGNSRLMWVLTRLEVRRFFFDYGLSFYALGFGHDEEDEFAEALIQRHDLRPKLAIVNVDGFFTGRRSEWAHRVMADGAWDAVKLQFEAEAAHAARRALHRVVPHWGDLYKRNREFVIYRSRTDGTWFVGTEFGEGSRFQEPPEESDAGELQLALREARRFKAEMERRGTKLVFCYVSNARESRRLAEFLARELDVPLVAPRVAGLRTIDGSHLARESAERFTRAFFAELRGILGPPDWQVSR